MTIPTQFLLCHQMPFLPSSHHCIWGPLGTPRRVFPLPYPLLFYGFPGSYYCYRNPYSAFHIWWAPQKSLGSPLGKGNLCSWGMWRACLGPGTGKGNSGFMTGEAGGVLVCQGCWNTLSWMTILDSRHAFSSVWGLELHDKDATKFASPRSVSLTAFSPCPQMATCLCVPITNVSPFSYKALRHGAIPMILFNWNHF